MSIHPKESCVSCHFFGKKTLRPANDLEQSVSEVERRQLQANDFSFIADDNVLPGCQMKVWTSVWKVNKTKLIEEVITTDRKNFCFYWPYRPGMAFLAAQTLQKRAAETKEAAHDRKLVIYSLWLAVIALFVQAILAVVGIVMSSYKS